MIFLILSLSKGEVAARYLPLATACWAGLRRFPLGAHFDVRSPGRCDSRNAARVSGVARRRSAQTAMARTRGEGSSSRRSATVSASAGRPLLPSAISRLRRKAVAAQALHRRLAEQAPGRPASSSSARSARRGAVNSARGRKAASPVRLGRTCSRDRPPGSRRSRRCGCPWAPRNSRVQCGPCARWSGRRCSAGHPAGRARGRRRSGRCRGQRRQAPQ